MSVDSIEVWSCGIHTSYHKVSPNVALVPVGGLVTVEEGREGGGEGEGGWRVGEGGRVGERGREGGGRVEG